MQPYIIFDMDGVLVDSEPFHKQILNKVFDIMGIHFTNEYYNTLVGSDGNSIWNKINADFKLNGVPEKLLKFHKDFFYKELEHNEMPSVTGVIELLESLKKDQFSLSLGSSSPKKLINIVVDRLAIRTYFDQLVSSEDVNKGKPNPDIFLEVANRYQKPSEDFVVIEDSKNGVIAAKTAGMKCIGYRNLNSGIQDLSQADIIVERFSEINGQLLREL